MNPTLASFFDNDQQYTFSKIWQPFKVEDYDADILLMGGECLKLSRKTKENKSIVLELGQENLYLIKDEQPKGQLNLITTRLETIKLESGTGIRLSLNQQHIDFTSTEINKWKSFLSQKCLLSTFHDDFQVVKMIGKGSFAKVYLATKKQNGVSYAIKAFNKEFMAEQFRGRESLENEIKVMRRLNQENLVKLHECHETQNSLYFVLDLVKGGELLNRLKVKQLNAVDLQILMYNLMKALAHIHSKKCMHRDLKPENLLLKDKDKDHEIVVADFGLAAFLNDDIIFKRCGTPGFVAPEILLYKDGEPIYDSKCDVFSAGVIFYMLLTGKQPFEAPDYKAILKANKNCEVAYNHKQILQAPVALNDLLRKMLLANPKVRPTSEECLKHPYFAQIFNQKDLLEVQENLQSYEREYLSGLKKRSFQSSQGSMELQQRQPALNGRVDTIGSLTNCSNSVSKIEIPQKLIQQSKFSQFSKPQSDQANQGQSESNSNDIGNSPVKKSNQGWDLHKIALKNSQHQRNMMSKDDDYINEEGPNLGAQITKLNSQEPKMLLKKSASYKIPKSTQQ